MKRAGADFQIQRRGQHAALIRPVIVQCANEILKIHWFDALKKSIPQYIVAIGPGSLHGRPVPTFEEKMIKTSHFWNDLHGPTFEDGYNGALQCL